MSKKLLSFILLLHSVSVSFCQLDSPRVGHLNEIIITANKVVQKQSTTGKVVSVITKEQIAKSAGKTITEVLNEQAGITINGALNNLGANQTVYMRGASSGRTLILMDGVPVYDPSNINNEFDLNLVSLTNVEQIEICRGSQSTLYGSDALAGVINIITQDPNIQKALNVKGAVSAGNYGTFRESLQAFGKTGKLSYSLKHSLLTSNGFSAAFDSSYHKGFSNNGYTGNSINGTLSYQLSDYVSVKGYMNNSYYKTNLDAGAFTDEKDYTVKNKSLMSGLGFHFQTTNVMLTANYQYNKTNRDYLNDSTDTPTFVKYSTDSYTGETQFAEIFTSIKLNNHFSLLQGADYRYSSFHSAYYSLSAFGPFKSKFTDTSLSQSSLYASLNFHAFKDRLNIELGGRLNVNSRYGSNSTFTFNPSYSFNKHIRIFGSIESGYKAPTLYQLHSGYGNGKLKAEKSKTYETGLQLTEQCVSGRVVYFNRDIRDALDFDNNKFTYFNFDRQTVQGEEAEIVIKPLKGLDISLNYTHLDPNESIQSRVTFRDTSYSYLLRRPNNSLNINAGYTCKNLYVNISGKYAGDRYDAGGYKKPDIILNSYLIFGTYAEYKLNKNLKAFTDLKNITDKKFYEISGYNSIPFMITGGITFSF